MVKGRDDSNLKIHFCNIVFTDYTTTSTGINSTEKIYRKQNHKNYQTQPM